MSIFFEQRLAEVSLLLEGLKASRVAAAVEKACEILVRASRLRLPILICGNGGSASDAQHIAAELVGRFLIERRACNVIALGADSAVVTAWANDYEYETVFSRQVEAYGRKGGVLWGISTSGRSKNVINAMKSARGLGMRTIGMTGLGGGLVSEFSDVLIDVPSAITPRIQEVHTVLYHLICEEVERGIASDNA